MRVARGEEENKVTTKSYDAIRSERASGLRDGHELTTTKMMRYYRLAIEAMDMLEQFGHHLIEDQRQIIRRRAAVVKGDLSASGSTDGEALS